MLEAGQTLLHYRLVDKLGEGGMGVVWRAVDTTLDREAAIKALPPAFAAETERLARFEREAKLLASLNHPHIAAVYGLHEADGQRFIAMELVGGQDLAQRLRFERLSLETALPIAQQVAEALEAAHESGVIHRDLKPANIKLDVEGRVKVLDFGLAKAFEPDGTSSGSTSLSLSPTVTSGGTVAGMVMGTASYMSPEQARGKAVDKRTDVWAFGCLLYEMLAGKRLHDGETVSDVLASVLKTDPDWEALPAETPRALVRLLKRCLTRDPKRRLRDIGDARIELEDIVSGGAVEAEEPAPRPRWLVPALVAGGILIGIVATLGFTDAFTPDAPPTPTRLSFVPPEGRIVTMPMTSVDGRTLIYWGREIEPVRGSDLWRIYTRSLETGEEHYVEGSDNGREMLMVSPDGRWIGFVARVAPGSRRQKLFKAPLDRSGPTTAVTDWPEGLDRQNPLWLTDGDVLAISADPPGLVRIPTDGRPAAAPLPLVDAGPALQVDLVAVLPGGTHAIGNFAHLTEAGYREDLRLVDIRNGQVRPLIENASMAAWSPGGRLVFSRRDQLLAVPFDLDTRETTGVPVTLAAGLWTPQPWRGAWFHLSRNGTLLTMPGGGGGDERTVGFLARDGAYQPWADLELAFQEVRTSPDGRQVAFTIDSITEGNPQWQIRVSGLDRPRLRTLAAVAGQDCEDPVWTPDSKRLIYRCSDEDGGTVWSQSADGSDAPRKVLEYGAGAPSVEPESLAADALLLSGGGSGPRVLLKRLDDDSEPIDLLPGDETARNASFSPDGRFIAYSSAETGRHEVYIRPYRDGRVGPKVLVTSQGGRAPIWSKVPRGSGLELLYLHDNRMWSVSIETEPKLSMTDPIVQFEDNDLRVETGSMLPDGRFFVILEGEQEAGASRIDVTLDFN